MWKCCVKAHNHPHHTLLHCSVMTYICLVLWHNNKTELFLQSEPMTLSQSLSMFGNILCLLRRVLVQIWSAARTANCCSVSRRRRERERERLCRLLTELQGISFVTVPGSCVDSEAECWPHQISGADTRQHSTDSTTPGHWERSSKSSYRHSTIPRNKKGKMIYIQRMIYMQAWVQSCHVRLCPASAR